MRIVLPTSRPRTRSFLVFLTAVLAAAPAAAQRVDYSGHKLVEVELRSPADLETMMAISPDFWGCSPRLGRVDWRVAPAAMADLAESGLAYRVRHEDVQALLDAQASSGAADGGPWFADFKDYAAVHAYIDVLATLRPDLASKLDLGTSLEGRTIFGLRITGPGDAAGRPGLLFNGCQHAREWISVMVPVYVADRLVRDYDTDAAVQALVDSAVFYIVPIVNPDGYQYSWDEDRLWRKNRRPNGGGSFGVDNNRNWGYQWGLDSGSSSNPNSQVYRGPAPFSEPETQRMRDFIVAHPDILAHIDFHSYSQLVLSPWGYVAAAPPSPHDATFDALNQAMAAAMFDLHGQTYVGGPIGSTLYLASGGSVDWSWGDRGIFAWTIELRDTGEFGFLLPADQIVPTCEEAFAAVVALTNYVTLPVAFGFPDGLPAAVPADADLPLLVHLNPLSQTVVEGSAKQFTRVGSAGAFVEQPLAPQADDLFLATLPATPCGKTIEFYFTVLTSGGQTVASPADAPATVHAALAQTVSILVDDGFESPSGWTVGAPDDDATSGIWERVNPQGTPAQPADDHTPPPGTLCWVTGGQAGPGIGSFDVDGGKTTLFSAVYDLSRAPNATISYWRWYSNDQGGAPHADVFVVDISADGGERWVNVETVGPDGPETVGGWRYHEFRVADFVTPTAAVRLRFIVSDEGAGSLVEAALDDFRIVDAGCAAPACPEDLDRDGVVGQSDLGILLADFGCPLAEPLPCEGDVDGDGDADQGDLGALLAVFGDACR